MVVILKAENGDCFDKDSYEFHQELFDLEDLMFDVIDELENEEPDNK